MIYLADSANARDVAALIDRFPIEGVTTNPTIVAREKGDFHELLFGIRRVIGPDLMLHVQTMQTEAEAMVREAMALRDALGGNFYVKIPATVEGLKAIRMLKIKGIKTTVFSCPK